MNDCSVELYYIYLNYDGAATYPSEAPDVIHVFVPIATDLLLVLSLVFPIFNLYT